MKQQTNFSLKIFSPLLLVIMTQCSFAQLTEAELIDTVQQDVLKYFWDYTHPVSKLSRERLHEVNLSFDENTIACMTSTKIVT